MSDLLIGLGKAEVKQPSEHVDDLAPTPEDEAMDEFLDAHERGDRKAARSALRSVIRICAMDRENYEDEEGT